MVDETDPRTIWRGIGRGLDQCFPPDREAPDDFNDLLEALRQRDARNNRRNGAEG